MDQANPQTRLAEARLTQSRADIAQWLADDLAAQRASTSSASSASPASGAGAPARANTSQQSATQTTMKLAAMALGAAADGWPSASSSPSTQGSPTSALLRGAEQALLGPTARAHPWALVGVAALGGAVVVAARPWRWLLQPALLASVLSPLLSQVVSGLAAQAFSANTANAPGAAEAAAAARNQAITHPP